MDALRQRTWLVAAALGLGLACIGCQTQFPDTNQTLPSPEYLKHPPGYIPQTPVYPLPRELANQEAAAAQMVTPVGPRNLLPPAGGPILPPGVPPGP